MKRTEDVVLFCRALRECGLKVTPAEAITAVASLSLIDIADREEVFLGLRSILTTSVDDFPVFKELFERFWSNAGRKPEALRAGAEKTPSVAGDRAARGLPFLIEHWTSARRVNAEPVDLPGASESESVAQKDFSTFTGEELEEVSRLSRRIAKRLARNPSRRWRAVARGRRVNLRRSLRLSLKTGGELIELAYRERRPKKTKLFVICDVSGSMDSYSRLLLLFVYGLQNSFARVESFVFATSLSRITGELKNKTYQRALDRLAAGVHGWSGGTRIGESLASFNRQWLRRIDKRTVIMILSDGWDTGEPEQLAASLAQLKERAGRLIWLNPLLGSAGYQPMTRGMQAALPFVNVFASAHDLGSLRALESHLVL